MWRSSNRSGRVDSPEDAASGALHVPFILRRANYVRPLWSRRKDRRDVRDRIEISGCRNRSCDCRVMRYGDDSPERPNLADILIRSREGRARGQLAISIGLVVAIWLCAAGNWIAKGAVVPWDSKNQFYAFFRFLSATLR